MLISNVRFESDDLSVRLSAEALRWKAHRFHRTSISNRRVWGLRARCTSDWIHGESNCCQPTIEIFVVRHVMIDERRTLTFFSFFAEIVNVPFWVLIFTSSGSKPRISKASWNFLDPSDSVTIISLSKQREQSIGGTQRNLNKSLYHSYHHGYSSWVIDYHWRCWRDHRGRIGRTAVAYGRSLFPNRERYSATRQGKRQANFLDYDRKACVQVHRRGLSSIDHIQWLVEENAKQFETKPLRNVCIDRDYKTSIEQTRD